MGYYAEITAADIERFNRYLEMKGKNKRSGGTAKPSTCEICGRHFPSRGKMRVHKDLEHRF